MALDESTYYDIIKLTTLTSIDLIFVYNDKVLVGMRNNNPAKATYFVPGCRTGKNELIRDGIMRVSREEVGLDIDPTNTKLLGVFDHVYHNNFKDDTFGTHYIVTAYLIKLDRDPVLLKDKQHSSLNWLTLKELKNCRTVHQYTKNYIPYIIESLKEYT